MTERIKFLAGCAAIFALGVLASAIERVRRPSWDEWWSTACPICEGGGGAPCYGCTL